MFKIFTIYIYVCVVHEIETMKKNSSIKLIKNKIKSKEEKVTKIYTSLYKYSHTYTNIHTYTHNEQL